MGYIIDGKYHREAPDVSSLSSKPNNSTYKQHEHNRQRKDFAREIVQPFDKNGKLSEDFKQAYPEEAKSYEKH